MPIEFGELLSKKIEGGKEEWADRAREDFCAFCEGVVRDEASGELVKLSEWQKEAIREIVGRRRVLLLAPRGHGKSTIFAIAYPSWLLGRNHNLRVVIVSSTEDQAVVLANAIEALLLDERYQKAFGNIVPPQRQSTWTDTHKFLIRDRPIKDPSVLACGITSSVVVGKRADVVICDDIVSEENARTPAQRQEVQERFWKTLLPVLVPGGKLIVVGTRWSYNDLYSSIMERWLPRTKTSEEPGWGIRHLSDDTAVLIYSTTPDKPLWPERFSVKELERFQHDMGTVRYKQQFMNIAVEPGENILPASALHFTTDIPPLEAMEVVMGLDPNISTSSTSDYYGLAILGVSPSGIYLLDCLRFRAQVSLQLHTILTYAKKYRVSVIVVENNLWQTIHQQLLAKEINIPVVGRMTVKDMTQRVIGMLPLFETGKVMVRGKEENGSYDTTTGLLQFIEEWTNFKPGGQSSDDILSAVEIALSYANPIAGVVASAEVAQEEQKASKEGIQVLAEGVETIVIPSTRDEVY